MNDGYASIAERYDRFFGGSFDQHDPRKVAFFERAFAAVGVKRVLDCACGTGRDLHLLVGLGLDVTGSDISPAMLSRARHNLATRGLELPLVEADYRRLAETFPDPFDAVVCLSTSLAHMPNEKQMVAALRSMRGALRDGGLLILSQGTTDRQWLERPRFITAVNEPDLVRLFVIDYEGHGATYHILDIIPGDTDGGLQHWSTEYPFIPLRDDQERLLEAAGFAAADFYGDWSGSPYDKERSGLLIAVARR